MKNILVFILFTNIIYSQGYFDGKELHCPTENYEAKRLFNSGIKILHLNRNLDPKYLAANADIFARSIMQDTTFCDAYFFTGYTLNLLKEYRKSYAFLKMADTLSSKPVLIYKQNVAAICLKVEHYNEARNYYQEIVKYFPDSPEGYYGIALTSPMIGDYKIGLENIEKSSKLYGSNASEQIQINYLKGILFALDEQYLKSKENLEKVSKNFKKDINFNIYYSLSLLKVAEQNNDEKMKKEALKYYEKIKDKDYIPENLKEYFVF